MRKQIAAANWKMNLSRQEGEDLMNAIVKADVNLKDNQLALFGVPFPYLVSMSSIIKGKQNLHLAAQNCSANKNGAYTGEVSTEMLKSIGIEYVIIGHSERREYQAESNSLLAEKLNRALESGLTPVFCCGEPLNIREASTQESYVHAQLKESLFHLSASDVQKVIIAYEPIWAIGTGKTASSAQAQEIHQYIRKALAEQYSPETADAISILYGGSVKASNASELFSQPDVDGGLVGGASLNAEEFTSIMKSLK